MGCTILGPDVSFHVEALPDWFRASRCFATLGREGKFCRQCLSNSGTEHVPDKFLRLVLTPSTRFHASANSSEPTTSE